MFSESTAFNINRPVHWSINPQIVKYAGDLYCWNEWKMGTDPTVLKGYVRINPVNVETIPKQKPVKNVYFIPSERIEQTKKMFRAFGLSPHYRIRGDKQYMTVKDIPFTWSWECVRTAIKELIPEADHTSGGGSEHTFRLNPEKTH